MGPTQKCLNHEGGALMKVISALEKTPERYITPSTMWGHREKVCVLSGVLLFETPWTAAHQAPLPIEFFQVRILELVVISSSRGSSWPRDQTCIPCIFCVAGGFFTADPWRPLQISKKILTRNLTCQHLNLGLSKLQNCEKWMTVVLATQLSVFFHTSLN